jgi:hypothetical protein
MVSPPVNRWQQFFEDLKTLVGESRRDLLTRPSRSITDVYAFIWFVSSSSCDVDTRFRHDLFAFQCRSQRSGYRLERQAR